MKQMNLDKLFWHPALRRLMLLCLGCSTVVVQAQPTTRYWIGWATNAASKRWSVATNWDPNGVPADGDSLVFGHTIPLADRQANIFNQGTLAIASITFTNDGYTLGVDAVTDGVALGTGGITVDAGVTDTNSNAVRFQIALSNNTSVVNNSTNAGLSFRPSNKYGATVVSITNTGYLLAIGGAGNINFLAGAGIVGTGDLTKEGTGTLTLTEISTYSGTTTVNGGRLQVNSGTNSGTGTGPVIVNSGGTLGGFGTIFGAVTNLGGTLAPGSALTPTGTLTVSNSVTLAGTCLMGLDRTNVQTSSRLVADAIDTTGGRLVVTNVGSSLEANDTFDLFDGPLSGSFAATNLPALTGGLEWDTSQLFVNGTIKVTGTAQPPATSISYSLLGNELVLTWPNDQAWRLQAQTNAASVGLTTSWSEVTGAISPFTNIVDPANGSVFFRLAYP